jgi:CheY-like chemotaxis protein
LRDSEGNRIGAYQFVYDITARLRDQERLRRAEEALLQTQKMDALGQLTGGVAHDFNNLLAVFATGLHVLQYDSTPEQRKRIFDGMRRAVTRGTGLTRHLLSFSRRQPVNPESIDLAVHLAGMHEMLHSSGDGGMHIEMNFAPDLWPVEIDAGEFDLAILNLCLNARDAMGGGGTITITAENLREAGEAGALTEHVKLSVADKGRGMPPEIRARATEPFFTTKDAGKGSGLGLPQVYGFAQQSGGRLIIESEVGVGTVVTLVLPRSLREPAAPTRVDNASSTSLRGDSARRGQILLVEDDDEVAALTGEMLNCLGFTVMHVTSPAAALGALANSREVDAVLSDIMMPGGVSGVELAHEIKRRHPNLRVVLATGYPDAAAGMTLEKTRLLLKPYSLEALAVALGVDVK